MSALPEWRLSFPHRGWPPHFRTGILGLDTDDENIKQAFDLAHEQGLEYHFDIKGDDASIHLSRSAIWSAT